MTNAGELVYMPIAELALLIQRKEISPVEIAKAVLARIEKFNPELNAYYTVFADEVLALGGYEVAETGRIQEP